MRGRKLISKGLNFVKLVLSKYNAYTFGLIAVDNKYEVYELKRQCPDAKYLDVEVSLYAIVEDQFLTPNAKIFLSSYIILKLLDCCYMLFYVFAGCWNQVLCNI